MNKLITLSLLVYLSICLSINGYANAINKLSTKEEIRQFLNANFAEKPFYYFTTPIRISQEEGINMYMTEPDTFMVEDPVTGSLIMKTVPKEKSSPEPYNNRRPRLHIPMQAISWLMTDTAWQFHKVDIDGNKQADLVIYLEQKEVLVVMDMKGQLDGYILSDSYDFLSYSFLSFLPMADGSNALLLKHNPCTLDKQTEQRKFITYVTDSTRRKADTLYKIVTLLTPTCDPEQPVYIERDTIDMKRYRVVDTLVYRANTFTRYNSKRSNPAVSRIIYHRNGGWIHHATCIEINRNGLCRLRYPRYDKLFEAVTDSAALTDFWALISNLNVGPRNIKTKFCSTGEKGSYTIHFDNGTVKQIKMSNSIPMDLSYISSKISDISFEVQWKPSEEATVANCLCAGARIPQQVNAIDCDCRSIDMVVCGPEE